MVNDHFYGYPGKLNLSLKDRSSGLFLACLRQHISIAVLKLARQCGHQGCDVPHTPCAGRPPFPLSKFAVPRPAQRQIIPLIETLASKKQTHQKHALLCINGMHFQGYLLC